MRRSGVGPVRVAVAGEDQAHRALVTFLADRVLLDEAAERVLGWIDADSLSGLRVFAGCGDDDHRPEHLRFYDTSRGGGAPEAVAGLRTREGRRLQRHGHIEGKPLRPRAGFWRDVLILLEHTEPTPDVIIIALDTDGHPDRIKDLEQAVAVTHRRPVIIAAPHQDAEGWFVAGFTPASDTEVRRLSTRRKALGFDPTAEPHRLTAHPNHAPTDAKRVLRILAFDEDASRPPSLEELPALCERTLRDLGLLERRGKDCGLVAFLADLRKHLVPLVIPGARLD